MPFIRFEKKAFVVLEAVELVGNPQGCPSGGGQLEELSTGAPNPQLAYFSRYFLSGKKRVAIRGQANKRVAGLLHPLPPRHEPYPW